MIASVKAAELYTCLIASPCVSVLGQSSRLRTVVTVRLASAVGSKLSSSGAHFSSPVARPVEVDGKGVVPAGAEALGKVVEAVPRGRFKGAASLRVIESVNVNGDSCDVTTSSVSRYLKVKVNRTATLIGGGTGGGTGGGMEPSGSAWVGASGIPTS